jgi:hypothetical protein
MSIRLLSALFVAATAFAVASGPAANAIGPEELLQQLPSGGIRFATQLTEHTPDSKGRFVIGQVDVDGLKLLADEYHSDFHSVLWLDHSRLVAFGGYGDTGVFFQTYVDGRPTGERVTVPNDVWKLKPGEELGMLFQFGRARKGQLWLGNCLQFNDEDPNRCRSWVGVPFDVDARTFGAPVRKMPAGFADARLYGPGIEPKRVKGVKAPPGFRIRLHKTDILDGSAMMGTGRGVPAFTCSSPEGSATWPSADVINWEFLPRPKKVHWLMQDPPLYAIGGPTTSPIATTGYGYMAFRGCSAQAMDAFALTGTPVWFELRYELADVVVTGAHWIVRIGSHELGKVPGSTWLFALAPE